ncbi:MAG TPA: LacI family DNA-binding transcriptional regulator [Gillisia sp.]|nr:LacI family DNA-binding transcriptional regulator [Gillisia sp.]
MHGKTTLKDLAALLNVSISTISKALHNSPEISPETRKKVQEAASARNYTPNLLAQGLKANKTKTIGVIVPDILNHFFARAVHGIETMASKYGYKVIICLSNESLKKEGESLELLVNGSVDGVIMSLSRETQSLENYDHFENAIKYDLPVALFDRTTSRLRCDRISINDELASLKATSYLLNSGCKKVIFLSTIHGTNVGESRRMGYEKATRAAGFPPITLNIEDYSHFEKDLLEVIKDREIDGVVAAEELSAVSVMRYALKNNFKIPEELSVIGFTNGILGENFVPSLTSVEQCAEEQGALATETLIKRIEKLIPGEPVQRVLDTTIIQRDSTRNFL